MTFEDTPMGFGVLFGGVMLVAWLVALIVCIIVLVCQMQLIGAAGRPKWSAFIPIYNAYVIYQITYGNSLGWLAFIAMGVAFIPFVGGVASVALSCYTSFYFAKAFGKSDGESILYVLFAPIMLIYWVATGKYCYIGPQPNLISPRFR